MLPFISVTKISTVPSAGVMVQVNVFPGAGAVSVAVSAVPSSFLLVYRIPATTSLSKVRVTVTGFPATKEGLCSLRTNGIL